MKSPKGNSIIEQLRQWLSGTAPEQTHAELQDAAAEDPFLAEALEGYEAFPDANHAESLQRSQRKLRALYPTKKKRSVIWLASRVAAAAVVVVVLVWGVQNMGMQKVSQEQMAVEESSSTKAATAETTEAPSESSSEMPPPAEDQKRQPSQPPTQEEPSFIAAAEPEAIEKPQAPSTISKNRNFQPTTEAEPAGPPPLEEEPPAAIAYDAPTPAAIPIQDEQLSVPTDTQLMADVPPPPAAFADEAEEIVVAESSMRKKREREPETIQEVKSRQTTSSPSAKRKSKNLLQQDSPQRVRTITGKVLDESSDEPLIGASIFHQPSQSQAITDIDGFFEMEIPADAQELSISYTGYSDQLADVAQKDYVEIRLGEGVTLSETVVIAYGAKDDDDNLNRYKRAKPQKGFRKFRKYLAANMVYPPEAIQKNIQGEVELSFNISNSGQPYNIKVKRSLGYGCDQEAIRLLEQGPDWSQPLPFKEKEVTYSFPFKLK